MGQRHRFDSSVANGGNRRFSVTMPLQLERLFLPARGKANIRYFAAIPKLLVKYPIGLAAVLVLGFGLDFPV